MVVLESNVEDVRCLLERWLNDLEQLMREAFRVKVCERVDPGFLTTVEILHRKVAWNAEDSFWIYDPIHTLALADEFGFVGKKQLEQTKSILVAPGSKTMNKGLHDGADVLDERETQQCRSLIGTALNVGQDKTRNAERNERSSEIHVRSHACCEGVCSNACVSITAKHPCTAGVFHIKKCSARSKW